MRQRALYKAAGGGPALATKRKKPWTNSTSCARAPGCGPSIPTSAPRSLRSRGALLPPQRPASPRSAGSANGSCGSCSGGIGASFVLHSPFRCDFGTQITIGDHFTGNFNLTILDEAPVHIGDHVFIGPNVGIYTRHARPAPRPAERGRHAVAARQDRGRRVDRRPGSHPSGRDRRPGRRRRCGQRRHTRHPGRHAGRRQSVPRAAPHCRGRPHRPGRDTELSTAYRTPYRSKRGKRLRRTRNEVTNRPKSAGPETAAAANKTGERCARPARLRRQSRRDDRNESGRTPP